MSKSLKNTTICLTMIIKNESKIIERCLTAAYPICDFITICDTGSEDNTVEIVQNFFSQHQKDFKGFLYHHQWQDFGHNRSLSLQVARDTGADYILCIDADMILQIKPQFNKNQLTHDSYQVIQRTTGLSYYNLRLLKYKFPWRCIGVTHEYYGCDEQTTSGRLTTLEIKDIGDGGCKDDKFERDIKLLTQGLIDEPDNVRYMFYLAQSYKDTKQWDKAIEWYTKRIEGGGWIEEVWYSKLQIGNMWNWKGEWEKALVYYLDAYNYHPNRSEPIYEIAKYYRTESMHQLAYTFCNLGVQIPYPVNDGLFINPKPYTTEFLWELCIICYYLGYKEMGLRASDSLYHHQIPNRDKANRDRFHDIDILMKNRLFYTQSITDLYPKTQINKINVKLPKGWLACNPSLTKIGKSIILCLRTVDYITHVDTGTYSYPNGSANTTNWIIEDFSTKITKNKKIKIDFTDEVDLDQFYDFTVNGLEDMKIFTIGNKRYGVATSRQLHQDGKACMALCHFNNQWQITKVLELRGWEDEKYQKNWMPFIHSGQLHFVYFCDPLTVLKANINTGVVQLVYKEENQNYRNNYRGTSKGVKWQNGWLFVVHETTHEYLQQTKSYHRTYIHRIIYMDRDFNIQAFTKPFWFKEQSVEFALGLEWSKDKRNLLIGFGYEDKEAYICSLCKEDLIDALEWNKQMKELRL